MLFHKFLIDHHGVWWFRLSQKQHLFKAQLGKITYRSLVKGLLDLFMVPVKYTSYLKKWLIVMGVEERLLLRNICWNIGTIIIFNFFSIK